MGNYYRNKINRWRSKMVKRRLAAGQGPDDYEFGMAATEAEKADATIATLTAERDALQKECDWWRRNGCEQSDMDKVRDCVESAKGIIATLTAERDALVAAIGVALPLLDRVPGDEYTLDEHDDIRIMKEMHLAAQLKEQPND